MADVKDERVRVILGGLDGLDGLVDCVSYPSVVDAVPPLGLKLLQRRHAMHAVNHEVYPFLFGGTHADEGVLQGP
jgi:hypothetical protein